MKYKGKITDDYDLVTKKYVDDSKFVRQGGGTDMGNNIVYLGWNTTGTDLLVQVDSTQIGAVATKSYVDTQIGNAINGSY